MAIYGFVAKVCALNNHLCTNRPPIHIVCGSWRVKMKRGESVAVIYLSLLVCLALGQSIKGT